MKSLQEWLAFIERQHPASIALGLERVADVFIRLKVEMPFPVITVGGTNGKGSTCAMLEAMLRAAGYRTALYTSPHLVRYNERVRIAGVEAGDEELAEAFAAVEASRKGTPLTYFEFGTLAALWLFSRARIDAAVLEVGLGGRLDAVNVVDPDCAVLTSVAIDHVDYLGADREAIGREKAGIFRRGRPAVVADPDPPQSVLQAPGQHLLINRDFGYAEQDRQWSYWGPGGRRGGLEHPALRGRVQLRNAAAALCALETLRDRRNNIETPAMGDRDAFGVKLGPAGAVVHVFQVRRGRVVDRIELLADERDTPGRAVREIAVWTMVEAPMCRGL